MRRSISVLLTIMSLFLLTVMLQAQDSSISIGLSSTDELGQFMVDAEGRTIYIFTEDSASVSNCSGDCLAAWPAVTVDSATAEIISDGISGEFGVIERSDTGEFQVTYNRQPLYTFIEDIGATDGQGLGDVWFVARPQIMGLGGTDELGSFLVDAAGNTLYLFTVDEDGTSNCTDDCLDAWPAFTVSNPDELIAGLGVVAQADLSLLEREDTGELQVLYQGQALYTFITDENAGDVTGQGVGDVWFVVNPVALSVTADGTLIGRDRLTLYIFTNDEEGVSNCNDQCAQAWPPLLATSEADLATIDESLASNTSLVTRDDGTLQIAYNGQPLYGFITDLLPEDTTGEGVGDVWFIATAEVMDAMDDSADVCTVSPASNVNLRGGPSTLYSLQGALLSTDAPTVTGQATGTDGFVWYQLDSGAWVRSDLVTATGACDNLPAAVVPPLPPTAVPAQPTAVPEQPSQPEQPTQPPAPPPATTEEA
ncbi:MAG: hypothetical protein AAFQ07_01030 [Chloroflexota bacterium]